MGDTIAQLATAIDVATHRLLAHIREFDQKGGWHTAGCLSCAHWLSWRIGMGLGAAREKVRVAKRLAELPLIDAAFAQGQVSYSKVRAMTRVATPENEEQLVVLARSSTAAQLEKMCRMYRGVQLLDREAQDVETYERYLVSRDTDDGMVTITLKVLPDEAARFMRAAETCAGGQGLIDGAVHMAELALAKPHPVAGEEATSVRPPVETVIRISAEDVGGYTETSIGGIHGRARPDGTACRSTTKLALIAFGPSAGGECIFSSPASIPQNSAEYIARPSCHLTGAPRSAVVRASRSIGV